MRPPTGHSTLKALAKTAAIRVPLTLAFQQAEVQVPNTTQGQDTGDDPAPTALEDPGTGQAFFLLGWIPPAVAAVIGGVMVAFATGNPLAFVGVALGGTLVGYVTGLLVLFTFGGALEGVGARVANLFLVLVVALSVAGALAVAFAASGFKLDPALERTLTSAGGLIVIVVLIGSVVLMRRSRS